MAGFDSTRDKIVTNATVIPYSSASQTDTLDALKILDEDPANTNNVLLVYSDRSDPKSSFNITGGWNREHLWPNSYGIDSHEPAYSDLFNLRPADINVNSARGNKYFDTSSPADGNYQPQAHAEAPACSTDTDSWEPPAGSKGDIARVIFYMDVRYEAGSQTNLALTDQTGLVNSSNALMGRLRTLLLWHRNDPVDEGERTRNERVFSLFQGNRNPFVDHPEWVNLIYETTPTAPLLFVTQQGTNVVLHWPMQFTNAVVETASSPTSQWSVILQSPALEGTNWTLAWPMTNTGRVFKLRVP